MSRAIDLCGFPKIDFCCNYFEVLHLCGLPKIDFCCNYFEVLHLYKLPLGRAFDLVVEVTQVILCHRSKAPPRTLYRIKYALAGSLYRCKTSK